MTKQTRLYDDEQFEYRGLHFKVNFPYDEDGGEPWSNSDGHGEVSDWTTRDKRPGELVLSSDRTSKRYYDFAGAIKAALKDGWDSPPYKTGTKRQQAERAVKADFEFLRGWCNDEWHYVGVVVKRVDEDGEELGETESLWGVEDNDSEYLTTTAYELADEIAGRVEAYDKALFSEVKA